MVCQRCDGTGEVMVYCASCGGAGTVEDRDDSVGYASYVKCPTCAATGISHMTGCGCASRRMTRQERLQGLADRGTDTWEEFRGER